MTSMKEPFENIMGKGKNAGPFPIMFSTLPKTKFNFSGTYILSSANALKLDQIKILSFGKELSCYNTVPSFNELSDRCFCEQIFLMEKWL